MFAVNHLVGFGANQIIAGGSPNYENVTSTRWRIYCTETQNAGSGWLTIREIEFRATIGGADQASGGTASASANNGTAGNCFDNSTGTQWQSGFAPTSGTPVWVEYTFGSAVSVAEVAININTVGDGPTKFLIQFYDGSNWITWRNVYFAPRWSSTGQTQTFKYTQTTPVKWRLNITAKQGAGNFAAIAELEFRATSGGADQATGGLAAASSSAGGSGASNAFDNNNSTQWGANDSNVPHWVEYWFTSEISAVDEVSLRGVSVANDNITAADVQYLNPMTNSWTTYWSFTTGTWTVAETRIFTKP